MTTDRPRPGRTIAALPAMLLAILLIAVGCSATDDADQAVPSSLPSDEAEPADWTEPPVGSAEAVAADEMSTTTIDLSLDEEPDVDLIDVGEELAESGYLEVAEEADLDVLAQDDCDGLVDTVLGQYQVLLDELGDAGRADTRAIDLAFESPVMDGRLISRRADEIGCDSDRITEGVCPALATLRSGGEVGDDIVGILGSRCGEV
ncbi:MAG: hypothetical protein AAF547_20220 [Actinomycetota bacterium]